MRWVGKTLLALTLVKVVINALIELLSEIPAAS